MCGARASPGPYAHASDELALRGARHKATPSGASARDDDVDFDIDDDEGFDFNAK